ncbi:N-acyl-L-amino acid amidohydrolase [bacterium HR23]|nr:N-acyl-L-amino acid amidohydrolase [bacterium HR23]
MPSPTVEELKARALRRIDQHREEIIGLAKSVLQEPEPGYTEVKTAQKVSQALARLGIPHQTGIALTGIKGYIPGGAGPGPTVAVMGELDSLRVPDHPHADRSTGAAHACGHHAQLGMLLGAVIGLTDPEVLRNLSGRIAVIAVPAEEFIDAEFRYRLRQEGKIGFLGGKQEFIRLGAFDDVDMAMMCHTTSAPEDGKLAVGGTSNGHIVKLVTFLGRAAHAGSSPWKGVNALNAANIALMALHTQRETLRDEDHVRFHGIMTAGGVAVSSVPAEVRLEWRVRAGTNEALEGANAKANRCFKAGALAVGATVRITSIAGYLPLLNNPLLQEVFLANAQRLVGKEGVVVHPPDRNRGGSTDMGDVSHILPVLHPYAGGARGTGHGNDYLVYDYELAVLNPAKAMALTVIDLLANGAVKAKEVKERFRPRLSKADYLRLQESRMGEEVYRGE